MRTPASKCPSAPDYLISGLSTDSALVQHLCPAPCSGLFPLKPSDFMLLERFLRVWHKVSLVGRRLLQRPLSWGWASAATVLLVGLHAYTGVIGSRTGSMAQQIRYRISKQLRNSDAAYKHALGNTQPDILRALPRCAGVGYISSIELL